MLRKVHVENGWVEGLPASDPRITSFKGIPYAAPPTGENRWRAPQPARNWEGVLQAYQFGPIPMQNEPGENKENVYTWEWNYDEHITQSEDCLSVNIWTPARCDEEGLPVFVWYFGGGLQYGNAAEMEFDGERLARRGIVVVTLNYRINAFGFLCHPEITFESPNAPANFGHLDQQAATRWVKRNIASFGGDPDNITIGGQSAGGGSVMTQLTSPQNEGLCQRAIVLSGLFTSLYPGANIPFQSPSLAEAEASGVAFFDYLQVENLQQARSIPANILRDKTKAYGKFFGTAPDGYFCIGNAFDQFVKNDRLNVPVMMGHTIDEFPVTPSVTSMAELETLAKQMFGNQAQEFLALCHSRFDSVTERKARASVNSIEYAMRRAARLSEENGRQEPIYYYSFNPTIPGWDHPGSFHSIDLWFFFETLAKCWRPFEGKHYDLARIMCNYLANFIKTGNPNGKDHDGKKMSEWQPYTMDAPYGIHFADDGAYLNQTDMSDMMRFLVNVDLEGNAK